jgi:hypothetical protein
VSKSVNGRHAVGERESAIVGNTSRSAVIAIEIQGHPSPKTLLSPNIIPLSETPHDNPEGGISNETQHAIGQEKHDSPGTYHLNY